MTTQPHRVRTRFAPSPTGFIHLGNIRSALYPWAYARHHGGDFILRIEDTDTERSSEEAVQVILQAMDWLGLDYDEGPFYQMQRMPRYREVLDQLRQSGMVYPCYMSTAELDALREQQLAAKQKPRYDGTWRPEPGKVLPPIPEGVQPVWRFKTPTTGVVAWHDFVKGRVEIRNEELDDLVVARPDGTPTYNFCVVVDDIDMQITDVIRGDDHVNNTPRQLHIFQALGAKPPRYAHLPTVLNEQGEKLSKRNGAKSVLQYRDEGYLPDAVVNYLARLGWSHGDAEIFSRAQFLEWFDLDHLGSSPAQFDEAKLRWVNAHYIKHTPAEELAALVRPLLDKDGIAHQTPDLAAVCALLHDRAQTLPELAQQTLLFYRPTAPDAAALEQHLGTQGKAAAADFLAQLIALHDWSREAISAALKSVLKQHGLKMPQLAMPVRLMVTGREQTPAVDAVLALLGRDTVVQRLEKYLG
ncbi:glutamate--tRNA ligase [Thiomonas arsenitoxydans]|jgi:glutamyl-tRNA synthetase|uniref:glutamate--tRNA ligase n=1 Tax=Thiomonas arsenitoxydans (strain DSM 22701 / CIP 110005 / 3As) TaxID=426114 RepID=UPI001ACEC08C|nr:glutamate--tRNA ligase [Thiomonas arsenitoxydans]MBN8775609.1 glutamate--tRNA ligase [Thiomonas arsenitoxydans]